MSKFSDLGLKKNILDALDRLQLVYPFEVQEKVIPLSKKGRNILFTSRTGSGKTLAYLLGVLDNINTKLGIQMLILVPTRELSIQIGKETRKVCDLLNIKVGVIYGGRALEGDYRTINRKNHILVATPGRLKQHVNEKNIKLGEVKVLVYDECDKMFTEKFYDDCAYLRIRVPLHTQIMLSSATLGDEVKKFVEEEIEDYDLLEVGERIPPNIIQELVRCSRLEKNDIILRLLKKKRFRRVIIFTNTKMKARSISKFLNYNKYFTKEISGKLEQKERDNYLGMFKKGTLPIIVTTDLTGRGLQIKDIDIVINYDLPFDSTSYIHRIGRTGRKDKKGYALTLLCPEDEDRYHNLNVEFNIKIKEVDHNLEII
ncbi:MAG: DEAD/DEAH box helicase [Candidatus Woesearchaeota archaeon]